MKNYDNAPPKPVNVANLNDRALMLNVKVGDTWQPPPEAAATILKTLTAIYEREEQR